MSVTLSTPSSLTLTLRGVSDKAAIKETQVKKAALKKTTAKNTNQSGYHILLSDDQNEFLTRIADEQLAQHIVDYPLAMSQLMDASMFTGKLATSAIGYGATSDSGTLLVGMGERGVVTGNGLQKVAKAIYTNLAKQTKTATLWLGDSLDDVQFGQLALALLNQSYRFEKYKSKPTDAPVLSEIVLVVADELLADFKNVLAFSIAVYAGQSFARDLANEPPNICHPEHLAAQAQALAKAYPDLLTVKIVDEKQMAKLGMNCFLAVSRGSDHEGQLVLMEYKGTTAKTAGKKAKKSANSSNLEQPIVMVGKGITFDSGGISLKPGLGMGEMKFDMGGAAAVLGMMKALCQANLPLQVVGALACAENMPSGQATRPGDIVTAMNGKTVEILNTDAEGRLVLCDTLVYVQRYKPSVIIDMATLTGAMVVALGNVRTGMFSNNEDVIFELEQASETAHDRIWHMPLDDDYQEQLNSNMADMQNIGGMPAGSVTAACFLSRFVEDIPWAHLDIAGTAWQTGKEPTGTGRPVPLLMHYLYRQAMQHQNAVAKNTGKNDKANNKA